jgi:hypothetical protein
VEDPAGTVPFDYVGPASACDEEWFEARLRAANSPCGTWTTDDSWARLMVARPHDLDHAYSLIASRAEIGDHRAALSDPDSDLGPLTGVRI